MVKNPELKAICLNQEQYNDLLDTVESCNESDYAEECCKLVTVETFNDIYIYRETTLTCEEAIVRTSLAFHVNITQVENIIKNKIRGV